MYILEETSLNVKELDHVWSKSPLFKSLRYDSVRDVDVVVDKQFRRNWAFIFTGKYLILTEEKGTFNVNHALVVFLFKVRAGKYVVLDNTLEFSLKGISHISIENDSQLEVVSGLNNTSYLEFNYIKTYVGDISIGCSRNSNQVVLDILNPESVCSSLSNCIEASGEVS